MVYYISGFHSGSYYINEFSYLRLELVHITHSSTEPYGDQTICLTMKDWMAGEISNDTMATNTVNMVEIVSGSQKVATTFVWEIFRINKERLGQHQTWFSRIHLLSLIDCRM